MPFWTPEPKWKDQDVFVIGGGTSLEKFDWELLRPDDVLTIGCNDAYLRGPDICNICVFGDKQWWTLHERGLEAYQASGQCSVFTNCPQLIKRQKKKPTISWLWMMERKHRGLHLDALSWGSNTGCVAVNLALLLGAKRVLLLGFDMKLTGGRANWHDNSLVKPSPVPYSGFIKGFRYIAKDLPEKFPGSEIINITDDSNLHVFPKIGVKEFWENRVVQKKKLAIGA